MHNYYRIPSLMPERQTGGVLGGSAHDEVFVEPQAPQLELLGPIVTGRKHTVAAVTCSSGDLDLTFELSLLDVARLALPKGVKRRTFTAPVSLRNKPATEIDCPPSQARRALVLMLSERLPKLPLRRREPGAPPAYRAPPPDQNAAWFAAILGRLNDIERAIAPKGDDEQN